MLVTSDLRGPLPFPYLSRACIWDILGSSRQARVPLPSRGADQQVDKARLGTDLGRAVLREDIWGSPSLWTEVLGAGGDGQLLQRPGGHEPEQQDGHGGQAPPQLQNSQTLPRPTLPIAALNSRPHSESLLGDNQDGRKGCRLLPGFGDHQILHHLPL